MWGPRTFFLPKVVSAFHLNQYIVFLSLCPAPVHQKKISFLLSGCGSGFVNLSLSHCVFQKDWSHFCHSRWALKGYPTSHSTISRWLRQTIVQAYILKDWVSSFPVKAHSTSSVNPPFCAFQHQAIFSQMSKAAHMVFWSHVLWVLAGGCFCIILCQLWVQCPSGGSSSCRQSSASCYYVWPV